MFGAHVRATNRDLSLLIAPRHNQLALKLIERCLSNQTSPCPLGAINRCTEKVINGFKQFHVGKINNTKLANVTLKSQMTVNVGGVWSAGVTSQDNEAVVCFHKSQ